MKVMKFGGASVGSGQRIRNVAQIVAAAHKEQPVVVISAMRGVTDAIERHLKTSATSEEQVPVLLHALKEKHREAIDGAIRDEKLRDSARYALGKTLERLERLLFGITYTEELTPKARDLALSFGERLSVHVLAGALRDLGHESRAFESEKVGIVTDGVYGNATPILPFIEENYHRNLSDYVRSGGIPVVTGFYGADQKGHATVFGRGGSDFVAAILAHAGNAKVLEIWKDVDGFMTTDPSVVAEARTIDVMSYDEAAELSNFGAKVLHPRTVEPVSLKAIPIRVLNTARPEDAGTLIVPFAKAEPRLMRSVAARRELAIVKLIGPGMAYTQGVGLRVFQALARRRINVINMAASQATFALLIDEADCDEAVRVLEEVKGGVVQEIEPVRGMALICVVGKGLAETPGTAAAILGAISGAGVNIEMISLGASNIAIDVIVRDVDKDRAVRSVHDAFLSQKAQKDLAERFPGYATREEPA